MEKQIMKIEDQTMLKKIDQVERLSKQLKGILEKARNHGDYELMLEAIEAYAFLHCSWNQDYTDRELEDALVQVGDAVWEDAFGREEADEKTVIFHDGFAVDMWSGLAYIYIKALLDLGYRVIHLSNADSENRQPQMKKAFQGKNIIFEYYCMNGADRLTQAKDITRIIDQYKPRYAFLYISPWDTASVLAYSRYQGVVKRFLVNATDHTFWLGHNAFDVCVEFRNYGASVSMRYRGLPKDRVVILPYYPVIDQNKEFEGFPFRTEGYQIVFSGGAPYKTRDDNNTFFKLVEAMLDKHPDVIFVYAPKSEELNCGHVQQKYPDRFFLVEKRKDLYQVLKHVDLYLGTYPVCGGLMMQYAAVAGRYMLVTAESDDVKGILAENVEEQIFYHSVEEMEADIDRLLDDHAYLKEKEKLVEHAVISEKEFTEELAHVIEGVGTKFAISDKPYDTKRWEYVFMERIDVDDIWSKGILRDEMRPALLKHFPKYFVKKEIGVAKKLVKSKLQRDA
jgi:hypothetical protein